MSDPENDESPFWTEIREVLGELEDDMAFVAASHLLMQLGGYIQGRFGSEAALEILDTIMDLIEEAEAENEEERAQ